MTVGFVDGRSRWLWVGALGLALGFGLIVTPCAQATPKLVKDGGAIYCYDGGTVVKSSWKTLKGKTYYLKSDGKAATGLTKVGKKWYFFKKNGVLQTTTAKDGKWTYYMVNHGKAVEARKKGSTYYYANGAKMTKADKKDYQAWTMARNIVKQVTKPSQSKAQKKLIVFKWVMAKYYKIHRYFRHTADWPAVYAMDHFKNTGGDCNADSAAFTYLAAAVGYKAYVVQGTLVNGHAPHAWCNIGHRSYDPLFAQAKNFSYYYGGHYEKGLYKIKIPYFSPKHAHESASSQASSDRIRTNLRGLVTKDGATYYYRDGLKVTSTWVTVNGKTYYFTKSGKAATGSVKLKRKGTKAYWVFSAKGVLLRGSGERVVKVAGASYRVAKSGKAKPGWNKAHTSYYLENGSRATGVRLVKGKLTAFTSKGAYQSALTAKLRAASVVNGDASALLGLLGDPDKRKVHENSCYFLRGMTGSDVVYTYEHVQLTTFLADDDGVEYLESVDER